MLERAWNIAPTVVALIVICVVVIGYRWLIYKFVPSWKRVRNMEIHPAMFWLVGVPSQLILAPALEELILRAPLIVVFSKMSEGAWRGILLASLTSAVFHFFADKDTDSPFIRGLSMFFLSLLAGFVGVVSQSLWWCLAVHSAWKVLFPLAVELARVVIELNRPRAADSQNKVYPPDPNT